MENRLLGVREMTPLRALESARSLPVVLPVCNLTMYWESK